MKIKELLNEYKNISKEMKNEAKKYNNLATTVKISTSKQTFEEYTKTWRKLIALNERAYKIMFEYRSLSNTLFYRFLFFCGVLPKQNTFRYTDNSKTTFKYNQMINLLYLK